MCNGDETASKASRPIVGTRTNIADKCGAYLMAVFVRTQRIVWPTCVLFTNMLIKLPRRCFNTRVRGAHTTQHVHTVFDVVGGLLREGCPCSQRGYGKMQSLHQQRREINEIFIYIPCRASTDCLCALAACSRSLVSNSSEHRDMTVRHFNPDSIEQHIRIERLYSIASYFELKRCAHKYLHSSRCVVYT